MKSNYIYILVFILGSFSNLLAQKEKIEDAFFFKGQFSTLGHYNFSNSDLLNLNARYIPQVNYELRFKSFQKIDIEVSANLFGKSDIYFLDSVDFDGYFKPYRSWIRYSGTDFEIRVGLQKINFGSALMLRPLMWFDRIDSRDPLQLTEGVSGLLGRYYFQNNSNLWLWLLYGNENTKGWEFIKTKKSIPEFGARFQFPIPLGEAAISYHHRNAFTTNNNIFLSEYDNINENKIGFDMKFDYLIGFWIEGVWINKAKELGILNNQEMLVGGLDYTFGIGNGLNATFEHLIFSNDEKAFAFSQTNSFSALSLSYPFGLFDNVSTILYYDWNSKNVYNFINWKRTFDRTSLNIMFYWNPENYNFPVANSSTEIYGGKGIIVMYVFNH